jgi:hypothetical protein
VPSPSNSEEAKLLEDFHSIFMTISNLPLHGQLTKASDQMIDEALREMER